MPLHLKPLSGAGCRAASVALDKARGVDSLVTCTLGACVTRWCLTFLSGLSSDNSVRPPPARGSTASGGKGSSRGRGKGSQAEGSGKYALGSEAHRVSHCDSNGVTHANDSLNTHLKVDRQMSLRADLVTEFGPEDEWCFPPMMSKMFGKGRFILCNKKHDPTHATANSSAHQYPRDYRQRVKRHFH